jgi:cAMP-dependent protein kinase regulator
MGPEAAAGTPLFRDFSQQELIEVMRGLSLEHFAPGEIIVTEGEAGDSLYVLASGSVRAWVRGASGRNVQVRELSEGDFFGEISLLTGEARSATITASAPCELLRLDRATVDTITTDHPRVLKILKAFHKQRGENSIEAMIRQMGAG